MEPKKVKTLMNIQRAKEFYVIMSKCTGLPYVSCNEETMDDEVFVYLNEEAAKDDVTVLAKRDELVDLIAIPQKNGIGFFDSLFCMGVNCVHIDKGTKEDTEFQLTEIVKRPSNEELPEGKKRVENPEFHLTAIYYMQKYRKNPKSVMIEELKDLREEMMVHFWEGTVLLAVEENGNRIPLLKKQDGKPYQPIFTDLHEFNKFYNVNRNMKYRLMTVKANKMPMVLAKEAEGAVVNPFGVNLILDIKRKETSEG